MNILFTSAGRRRYLIEYFLRELSPQDSVHIANSVPNCASFSLNVPRVVTPPIYSDEYIPFLLHYCQKNSISAIISLFDVDLPILSSNSRTFQEHGILPIVASPWTISICNDKWKTHVYLENNSISTPKSFIEAEDAKNAIKNNVIKFPVIVKPRWGMGSIAIEKATTFKELEFLLEKVREQIFDSYLRYESQDTESKCILIQEAIVADEYGLDIINDLSGNYQTTCIKRKLSMRSGETDSAITVQMDELENLGKRISTLFRHPANLDVDLFLTESGPKVLEMNARFGGGYPFSHLAGINLPKAILGWLRKENVSHDCFNWIPGVCGVKSVAPVILNYDASN